MKKPNRAVAGVMILSGGLLSGYSSHAAYAGLRAPVVLVSSSPAFDSACPAYYRQGNDADVQKNAAEPFCGCITANIEAQGLGSEVLDFLGRTYSEDLTAFIGEYPNGEAWMDAYFAAEQQCKKETDFGSNQPPPAGANAKPSNEAASCAASIDPSRDFTKHAVEQHGVCRPIPDRA